MKHILLPALCTMLLTISSMAQSFVGTLTTNGYEKNDVTVKITQINAQQATLSMFNAKFSRWMPVKVDLDITPVNYDTNKKLSANNIIPTSDGKKYENRIVRQLKGSVNGNTLTFKCLMGEKNVSFSGRAKSR
ncbi:MAG: hypothetical protein IJP95_02895 [Bacteroidales bacterium]|nr:hypothetical protein [Bacteroidales bacterium]